jgi:hypothetical protein
VKHPEELSWVAGLKAVHMIVNVVYLYGKETAGQYLENLRNSLS